MANLVKRYGTAIVNTLTRPLSRKVKLYEFHENSQEQQNAIANALYREPLQATPEGRARLEREKKPVENSQEKQNAIARAIYEEPLKATPEGRARLAKEKVAKRKPVKRYSDLPQYEQQRRVMEANRNKDINASGKGVGP